MRIFTLLLALCLLPAVSAAETRVVNESWGGTRFNWTRNDGMLVRWQVFDVEGKLEVCVAYSSFGGTNSQFNRLALREAQLRTRDGDNRVLRNLSFGKLHSSRAEPKKLVGFEASCKVTKLDFPTEYPVTYIKWREGRYSL
ncbi:MAG: hypothetical protein AAF092_13835 [Pseudomonadota bacterium]